MELRNLDKDGSQKFLVKKQWRRHYANYDLLRRQATAFSPLRRTSGGGRKAGLVTLLSPSSSRNKKKSEDNLLEEPLLRPDESSSPDNISDIDPLRAALTAMSAITSVSRASKIAISLFSYFQNMYVAYPSSSAPLLPLHLWLVKRFLRSLQAEFGAANRFWSEYIMVAHEILREGLNSLQVLAPILRAAPGRDARTPTYRRLVKQIYMEYYVEVMSLQSFAITHCDMLGHLMDLHLPPSSSPRFGLSPDRIPPGLDNLAMFNYTDHLAPLLGLIESVYAEYFTMGIDLARARCDLSVLNWKVHEGRDKMRQLYLTTGICLGLALWVLWDIFEEPSQGFNLFASPLLYIFLAVGNIILVSWFWALCILVWRRLGINYVAILGLEHIIDSSPRKAFIHCANSTITFFLFFVFTYKLGRNQAEGIKAAPIFTFPALLIIKTAFDMFFPWDSQRHMWSTLKDLLLAPYGRITFKEIFFGASLSSLVKVYAFTAISVCLLVTGELFEKDEALSLQSMTKCGSSSVTQHWIVPILNVWPALIRMFQNLRLYYETRARWPYFWNAVKYMMIAVVIVMGFFTPRHSRSPFSSHASPRELVWMATYFLTTFYTSWWDAYQGWGLLRTGEETGNDQYPFLRKVLLINRRHCYLYYLAMVQNTFLRSLWVISLFPQASTGSFAEFQFKITFFLPSLEIYRRAVWAIFRLEFEQIKRLKMRTRNLPHYNQDRVVVGASRFMRLLRQLELLAKSVESKTEDGKFGREEGYHWYDSDWGAALQVVLICLVVVAVALLSYYI